MGINFQKKSKILFAQLIIIGGAILALLIFGLRQSSNFVFEKTGQVLASRAEAACSCQIINNETNYFLIGVAGLFALSIVGALCFAIIKTLLSIVKTKKFLNDKNIKFKEFSPRLKRVAAETALTKYVKEVDTESPLIFCQGFFTPRIYISKSVVRALGYAQLKSVLLHEYFHLQNFEPAKFLAIKFIEAFTFLPGIKKLTKKYLSLAEIAADELATESFQTKNYLASAMAKMIELEEKSVLQKGLALSYFSQITEERVLALSDKKYRPTFAKEMAAVSSSLGAIALLILVLPSKSVATNFNQEAILNGKCQDKLLVEKCQQQSQSEILRYFNNLQNSSKSSFGG